VALSVLLRILSFFRRTELNLEELIYRQDIIYIGGGNTANLLAVWRLHGLSYGGASDKG